MLFNSFEFIFVFLPLTLVGFFTVGRFLGPRAGIGFLIAASLFFYGWWNPNYLGLVLGSVAANFSFGRLIARARRTQRPRWAKAWMVAAVAANLGLLGWFKYANFFVNTVNVASGATYNLERIILPLAISFFTFQQVAYVVDAYRGKAREYTLVEYCFLVTFFPHLIAGPIVQHGELLSQLRPEVFRPDRRNLELGASLFVVGLFKKVMIADLIAPLVGPVYDAPPGAVAPTVFVAWLATLAYSLQLYFDFSGYSDMAIGLARMFNFRFPLNFDSPYKATSPIDFWRRWHLTLSRFLREYLYFSLGGNRRGEGMRQFNLMVTMLLGGLWHGAGWGFVLWGGLNGVYLVANHLWRKVFGEPQRGARRWTPGLEVGVLATFVAIMISRVFFRAPTLDGALTVLGSLLGGAPAGLAEGLRTHGLALAALVAVYVWCRVMPHTQQVFARFDPVVQPIAAPALPGWQWSFGPRWALVAGAMAFTSILGLSHVSAFLYFQF